jgi:hypothetical protein
MNVGTSNVTDEGTTWDKKSPEKRGLFCIWLWSHGDLNPKFNHAMVA